LPAFRRILTPFRFAFALLLHYLFHEGVPFIAGGTPTYPLGRLVAAILAEEDGFRFRHKEEIFKN
jgi:hypothetical protein